MDKEYFESHALRCNVCGKAPHMMSEQKMDSRMVSAIGVPKYRVVCYCRENSTGLCVSPENALKAWNKKQNMKKEGKNEIKLKEY